MGKMKSKCINLLLGIKIWVKIFLVRCIQIQAAIKTFEVCYWEMYFSA